MKTTLLLLCAIAAAIDSGAQIPDKKLQLESPDFGNGGKIPKRFTCDDQDTNPTLKISGVPQAAKSLVLIMDDPDAPAGTWTHWLVWNIPADAKEIISGSVPTGAVLGLNSFKKTKYGGPCPPSGEHRYYFRLHALDTKVNVPAGASRSALETAMKGHVLEQATLMGKYSRQK